MVNDESNRKFTKGTWTKAEDQQLMEIVREMGPKRWSTIAEKLEGRIGKQCRERWYNHLDPTIKKTPWTEKEIDILIQEQKRLGNKWAEISKALEGRPNNQCKNQFNSIMNKKNKKIKKAKYKRSKSATAERKEELIKAKENELLTTSPLLNPQLAKQKETTHQKKQTWTAQATIMQQQQQQQHVIPTNNGAIYIENLSNLINNPITTSQKKKKRVQCNKLIHHNLHHHKTYNK
mmetsp:Transcript_11792/g.17508  ORF Transcript_11792/g.17508 Transcript_11792/m.17508 type:complete len:234 (+) Transcript_11792:186-887(+)